MKHGGLGEGHHGCVEFKPKPQGLSHEEKGEWVGSQSNMAGEGNQPVSQVFTGKQEALAFGGMTPGVFHLSSENATCPGFGFLFLLPFFSTSD